MDVESKHFQIVHIPAAIPISTKPIDGNIEPQSPPFICREGELNIKDPIEQKAQIQIPDRTSPKGHKVVLHDSGALPIQTTLIGCRLYDSDAEEDTLTKAEKSEIVSHMNMKELETITHMKMEESLKSTPLEVKESEMATPMNVEQSKTVTPIKGDESVTLTPMNQPESMQVTLMQIDESITLVVSDSTSQQPPNSIAKKNDGKMKSKLTDKCTMLEKRSPAFLRMAYHPNCIQIDIFDENSAPVLTKQIIKECSNKRMVRFPVIKEISMRYIVGKDNIKIPQIITANVDIFLCPLVDCNEGFLDPVVARNHALSHLDLRPFSCHFLGCGWTFAKESHLQRHRATHENTKSYPCDEPGCDKLFTTVYNLNEHRKKRHVQPATKLCPVLNCNEIFRNNKELRRHCSKQHDLCDAPFKCSTTGCKKAFFSLSTLEVHTKCHLEENLHICTYNNCNKVFQQAYRLKEHMRCHTGAKPYKCTIGKCTKAFTTASKLKRHERSHFDDKHHYCNIEGCDKAFKRSDHLNEHIRQVHKSITPGQKASLPMVVEASETGPLLSSYFNENSSMQPLGIVSRPIPHVIASAHTSTSRCHTITSEDEESDLSNFVGFNLLSDSNMPGCSHVPVYSNMAGCFKTEDELLDEAIKSIGVQEMKLETDLFLDEPLDLSDFSTVNLRDLQ